MINEGLYTPGCISTYSGQFIEVNRPEVTKIYPIDIAVALSRECRFGGHTKKFYSVAEHSVECMTLCEELHPNNISLAFKTLLHDAHEAYIKDIPSPIKKHLSGYLELQEKWQHVINIRYACQPSAEEDVLIAEIDRIVLEREWDTKKVSWRGLVMDDKSRVDLFIHHFTRLCRTPFAIMP